MTHDWVVAYGARKERKLRIGAPVWVCSLCGARAGTLKKPASDAGIGRDGYTNTGGSMSCGEYSAFSVVES